MKRFVQLNKEYRELEPLVEAGDRYARMVRDLEAAKEILQVEKDEELRKFFVLFSCCYESNSSDSHNACYSSNANFTSCGDLVALCCISRNV